MYVLAPPGETFRPNLGRSRSHWMMVRAPAAKASTARLVTFPRIRRSSLVTFLSGRQSPGNHLDRMSVWPPATVSNYLAQLYEYRKRSKSRNCRLLISGSKVRVLDGPPIESATSVPSGVADAVWF